MPGDDLGRGVAIELLRTSVRSTAEKSRTVARRLGRCESVSSVWPRRGPGSFQRRSYMVVSRSYGVSENVDTYPGSCEGVRLGVSSVLEDVFGEVVQVLSRIGVVESFTESIDKDIWCRGLDFNLWVMITFILERQEDIASRDCRFRVIGPDADATFGDAVIATSTCAVSASAKIIHDNRLNINPTQK